MSGAGSSRHRGAFAKRYVDRLLDACDDETRRALLTVSLLDEASAAVLAQMTDIDIERITETLERSHDASLRHWTDDRGVRWYRHHDLVRDELRKRVKRELTEEQQLLAYHRGRFRIEYLLRGIFLIAAGLLLVQWSIRIDIVLPYIGATFIAAVPFVFLRSRWLLLSASAIFAAAPLIAQYVRTSLAFQHELLHSGVSNHPVAYMIEWFFTGRAYHVTWLLPFVLLGIVFGRNMLRPKWSFHWLAPVGVVILAGYWLYTRQVDETLRVRGDHAELFFDLGRALVVYGLLAVILNTRFPGPRFAARAIASPVTLVGRMPITAYVLHVMIVTVILQSSLAEPPVSRASSFIALALVFGLTIAFSAAWGLTLGVGPVERLMGVFSLRHRPKWALQVRPVRKRELGLVRESETGRAEAVAT